MGSGEVVAFLRQLLKHLRHHVVLFWDSANPLKGARLKQFPEKHPRLRTSRPFTYAKINNSTEPLTC